MSGCFQFITISSSSPVLPYDSIINWFSCTAFPHYRCLTLVRDANTSNLFHRDIGFGNGFRHCAVLCAPYFFGIMFYPTGLRKYLFEFFLRNADDVALLIKNDTAAAGGTLVECKDVMRHFSSFKS